MDLADIRAVMGWTQGEAAYLLGIPQRTVSRIEAGERVDLTDDQMVRLRRMHARAERRRAVPA
jgi:plasmid maintenance system antidote protein VapI